MSRTPLTDTLPDFPWDTLTAVKKRAGEHPEGMIDLSVGSPVDPVAPGIQLALSEGAAFSGYPKTIGTPELKEAIITSLSRRYQVSGLEPEAVLPVVGTKEAIAWLPTTLGLKPGKSTVVIPELSYPTYEVGARLAGAETKRADSTLALGPARPDLIFLNSPSNPTGQVLGVEHLKKMVQFARERGAILASDECYLGLGWDDNNPPRSILDPEVCGGDHTGLIAIHSLSKTSNFAAYRGGFLAGDQKLIAELGEVRKHAGLITPFPVQAAMVAALEDDTHEQLQKLRYASRRAKLLRAFVTAGFDVEHSEAGLYLWLTRGENGRKTVADLAELGILVAPGEFYGHKGENFIRVALTATDEQVAAAVTRLGAGSGR